METVLPRARSLGSLLLFGSEIKRQRVNEPRFRGELCDRGKILVPIVCGLLVRGSLLGLHDNMAREEKYIVRDTFS